MADAPPNGANGSERLDSWKAIAAYLQRDERTAQRWERELGLPVRRVPGRRGRSVFAFTSEIDQWLKTTQPGAPSVAPPPPVRPARSLWAAAAVILVLLASLGIWQVTQRSADASPLRMEFTPAGLVARDAAGVERWRYPFGTGARAEVVYGHPASVELRLASTGIMGAAGLIVNTADDTVSSGELVWLTPGGELQRKFTFEDRFMFGAGEYGSPWGITDFREDDKGRTGRVAVAAHHYTWWPSMVTVLDGMWQRRGTFVNAGWIERVHWMSPDRLLVAGFSNPVDGGVVAILDANALDGQSPDTGDAQYRCATCGSGSPLRYVVMPRTEINRVTQSRFNRARVQILPDRIIARTVEKMTSEEDVADAVYEFTPSLDMISASFSTRYWELHRQLEMEGKLDHTREQCPDRNGPREIKVWEPATGWRTVKLGSV